MASQEETEVKYEFSQEENLEFETLIGNLKSFLVPLLFFAMVESVATLYLYFLFDNPWAPSLYPFSALLVLVCVCMGAFIHRAQQDFHLIVATEGSDIELLLQALTRVRKSLMFASVLVFGLLVLLTGALADVVRILFTF